MLNKPRPPGVDEVNATLGVEAVLWTPADLPMIRAELGVPA